MPEQVIWQNRLVLIVEGELHFSRVGDHSDFYFAAEDDEGAMVIVPETDGRVFVRSVEVEGDALVCTADYRFQIVNPLRSTCRLEALLCLSSPSN